VILTEPLDERQIQELHSNYHDLEETVAQLRWKLRREKNKRRDMAQELSRYIDQYEQCSADRRRYQRGVQEIVRVRDELMDADQGEGYPMEGSVWALNTVLQIFGEVPD